MRNLKTHALCLLLASVTAAGIAAEVDHRVSVRQLMLSAITPATNTLWGAEENMSEEAWKSMADAAIVVMASGSLVKTGGSGEKDGDWAKDAAWQDYTDVMIAAAADALAASESRDFEALMIATEVMYPPCEECHQQFHPDMQP